MPGWSDANGNAQTEQEVEVKVVLWLAETFPAPDVEIDWTPLDTYGMMCRPPFTQQFALD